MEKSSTVYVGLEAGLHNASSQLSFAMTAFEVPGVAYAIVQGTPLLLGERGPQRSAAVDLANVDYALLDPVVHETDAHAELVGQLLDSDLAGPLYGETSDGDDVAMANPLDPAEGERLALGAV